MSLAVTSLFIAMKIEEHGKALLSPLLDVLKGLHEVELDRRTILRLEVKLLQALDFTILKFSSIDFLVRYLRLYGFQGS